MSSRAWSKFKSSLSFSSAQWLMSMNESPRSKTDCRDTVAAAITTDLKFFFYRSSGLQVQLLKFHWSFKTRGPLVCITHLIAEDMLKSAVIEETTFKHSPWAGADNPLGPKFWCQQVGLITMVICWNLQRIPSTSDFIHIFSWFNKCI